MRLHYSWYRFDAQRFADVAALLLKHGAPMTAAVATALGNAEWLRARHAAGALSNPIEDTGGLLRIAVTHNRPRCAPVAARFRLRSRRAYAASVRAMNRRSRGAWRYSNLSRRENTRWPRCSFNVEPIPTPPSTRVAIPYFRLTHTKTGKCSRCCRDMVAFRPLRPRGSSGRRTSPGKCWQVRHDIASTASAVRRLPNSCSGVRRAAAIPRSCEWRSNGWTGRATIRAGSRSWNNRCERGHTVQSGDDLPRDAYLACFRLVLERCDPNLRGRPTDEQQFGLTTLHNIVARGDMTPEERVAFATAILDRGGSLNIRDHLLTSTPLGWACRWGQLPLVKLFLDRGADAIEADAEPWARPIIWAEKKGYDEIADYLRQAAGRSPNV